METWQLINRAKDDRGTILAVQLTKENASDVAYWCGGQKVMTYDPILHDEIGKVGMNYEGRYGTERANEGDFIMEDDFGEFRRVSPSMFLSVYERA